METESTPDGLCVTGIFTFRFIPIEAKPFRKASRYAERCAGVEFKSVGFHYTLRRIKDDWAVVHRKPFCHKCLRVNGERLMRRMGTLTGKSVGFLYILAFFSDQRIQCVLSHIMLHISKLD